MPEIRQSTRALPDNRLVWVGRPVAEGAAVQIEDLTIKTVFPDFEMVSSGDEPVLKNEATVLNTANGRIVYRVPSALSARRLGIGDWERLSECPIPSPQSLIASLEMH